MTPTFNVKPGNDPGGEGVVEATFHSKEIVATLPCHLYFPPSPYFLL